MACDEKTIDQGERLISSLMDDREIRFITGGKEYILRRRENEWILFRTWGEDRFAASCEIRDGSGTLRDIFTALIRENGLSGARGTRLEIAIDIIER